MDKLVSIIIPTYNRAPQLRRALESITRQQEFPPEEVEVIVVDDCSTDGTWDSLISGWVIPQRLPGLRITHTHRQSGSPVIPRNIGCRMARGEYLATLDSDDTWDSRKLTIQLQWMDITGAAISYTDAHIHYPDGRRELWSKTSTCHSGRVFPYLIRKNFMPTSTVVIRRDIWEQYGPMDISLDVSHDWDLWLKVAHEYEVHFIDAPLCTLYLLEGSVISQIHRRRVESRQVVQKWMPHVDGMWYRKVLLYYYLMEVFDILPRSWQQWLRDRWYNQARFLK